MHGGSSENKIENGKESVLAHLPSLSLGFKDLSMLHWSKINLNDPLKASAREKHQYLALHLKSLSTAGCTRPSKPPPPSSGRAGHLLSCHRHLDRAGVHPQHSHATGGLDLQLRHTQEPPGTTSTAGPRA